MVFATARSIAVAGCLLLGSMVCVDSAEPGPSVIDAPADWTRFGVDAARSNALDAATGITADNVSSLRQQQVEIDGTVDASAIYLHDAQVNGATHDVFFVTTTYGKTIAVDAGDGSVLWEFTPPGYDTWAGSHRITTATPVADPDREYIYAASPDGRIQKLAVADGHALWRTAITRRPEREKIAAALNYHRGHVIATTGGYIGDAPPYQGHVAVLDAGSGSLLHVWNALCSDRHVLLQPSSCSESGAAIWGRAGAVVDTVRNSIFVATGDGRWDGRTFWGDAVIELDDDATQMLGNYTPPNTETLDSRDADLGSTAPVLLADELVAQGGKDALVRVLAWQQMRGTTPHRDNERQVVRTPSNDRLFTAPAVWKHGSTVWMFAADNGGTAAWTVSGGRLRTRWRNDRGGTSPVVAGGLLYVYDPGGGLVVYDPESGRRVAELDAGSGHWNSPIVVDGRIALPEGNANRHRTSGVIDIWRAGEP